MFNDLDIPSECQILTCWCYILEEEKYPKNQIFTVAFQALAELAPLYPCVFLPSSLYTALGSSVALESFSREGFGLVLSSA